MEGRVEARKRKREERRKEVTDRMEGEKRREEKRGVKDDR